METSFFFLILIWTCELAKNVHEIMRSLTKDDQNKFLEQALAFRIDSISGK